MTASKWLSVTVSCIIIGESYSQTNDSDIIINYDLFDSRDQYFFDFYLNITSMLHETKCVMIVDTRETDEYPYEDFERSLVEYLVTYSLTFIYIDLQMLGDMSGVGCGVSNETKINFLCQKQIIFIISKTYDDLLSIISRSAVPAFEYSSQSLFVVVIKSQYLKNVPCRVPEYEASLKLLMGEVFIKIWNVYKILETSILLPFVCGNLTVLRYDPIMENAEKNASLGVTIISKSELMNNQNAILHKYRSLNGYHLEVKLFTRVPTLVKNLPESLLSTYMKGDVASIGYVGGIDGFMLGNMVQYLNFSTTISGSDDGYEYGWKMPNGTFTGTIGDVVYRRADISFNARFLMLYDTDAIEFTYPVYFDQFCVLAPKSLKIPTWINIFQGFSITAWEATVATAFICGVVWWLMKIWSPQREPASRQRLACCFYFMDANLLITSYSIVMPTLPRERIFISACLLFNIIFTSVFQSYLNTAFSTISYYPDIDSLEALDRSGVPVASSSRLDFVFGNFNALFSSLQRNMRRLKTSAIDEAAFKRTVCAVERRTDAQLLIELQYSGEDGEPLLHVVKECPRNYHLSYIVSKGYPFLSNMNDYMRRIVEAGLNDFWYELTVYSIVLKEKFKHHSDDSLKKLSLVDVQTAFFALGIGLVMSALAFVCEICYYCVGRRKMRRTSKSRPAVDGKSRDPTPEYRFVSYLE